MLDWLVGWLADWLVCWLAGWLADWLVEWFAEWSAVTIKFIYLEWLQAMCCSIELHAVVSPSIGSGAAVGAVGFSDGARVVAVAGALHAPLPTRFFAATMKRYCVPARRPLATKEALRPCTRRLSLSGPLIASAEISYRSVGGEPWRGGASHVRETASHDVACALRLEGAETSCGVDGGRGGDGGHGGGLGGSMKPGG